MGNLSASDWIALVTLVGGALGTLITVVLWISRWVEKTKALADQLERLEKTIDEIVKPLISAVTSLAGRQPDPTLGSETPPVRSRSRGRTTTAGRLQPAAGRGRGSRQGS